MAEINSTNGGSDAVAAGAILKTKMFVYDAAAAHVIACFCFFCFAMSGFFSATWVGLVIAILNTFNLWFWLPKLVFAYKVAEKCRQDSIK